MLCYSYNVTSEYFSQNMLLVKETTMKDRTYLKQFLVKCWTKLVAFFEWAEKHPTVDKLVSAMVKIVIYFITRD